MTLPLTSDQLNDLGALASAADDSPSDGSLRASYYQYLAAAGDPYGALASGVADGSTLTGLVARYFLADEGYALHGVTISADLMNQISVTLMNDDYADRLQSQGAALDYGQIKDYHTDVFDSVNLGIDCWTAYEPATLLGTGAWSVILNYGLLGSAGVWGEMLAVATTPLTDEYSSGDQQVYGEISADQDAAVKWISAVTVATAQALTAATAADWQPGQIYGSPINYSDPIAPPNQPDILDISATSVQFATSGTGQSGDTYVTVGSDTDASISVTR